MRNALRERDRRGFRHEQFRAQTIRTRGFSFRFDGPLDMRMDQRQQLRAYDIVNEESEEELARIIFDYGEDRALARIARAIVEARRRRPLETTGELASSGRRRARWASPGRDQSGDADLSGAAHRRQPRTRKLLTLFLEQAPSAAACGRTNGHDRVSFAGGSSGQARLPAAGPRGGLCGVTRKALRPERGRSDARIRARAAPVCAVSNGRRNESPAQADAAVED